MSANIAQDHPAITVRLPIKLGQFIKLANLAEDGAEAREMIQSGMVTVNQQLELRRGRALKENDQVTVDYGGQVVTVTVAAA